MDAELNISTPYDGAKFAQGVLKSSSHVSEKRPLYRERRTVGEYPLDNLGPLKDVALSIQRKTQAPAALAAQAVLATVTLIAQAHRDVSIPGAGIKPISGFFVTIAESGERKTTVDRLALAGVHKVEAEWRAASPNAQLDFNNKLEVWETEKDRLKKQHKSDPLALVSALNLLGAAPSPPPSNMVVVSDPTPEALTMHFAEGRPYGGVFASEGGLLVGGAAFSDEARLRTGALFNTFWDGEPIRRKRVGTGETFLAGRRCTSHIMIQPVLTGQFFDEALFDGIGLTARMLVVSPASTAGSRFFQEPFAKDDEVLSHYNNWLGSMMKQAPRMNALLSDALDPVPMTIEGEARQAWVEFYNQCEAAIGKEGPLRPVKAFGAKLPEHAARLAAVLSFYKDCTSTVVSSEAMKNAIALCYHYGTEMLSLVEGASIPQELQQAQKLLEWWQRQASPDLHLAKVYQHGPNSLRSAAAAGKAMKVLVEHGWAREIEGGGIFDGKQRRFAWKLIP